MREQQVPLRTNTKKSRAPGPAIRNSTCVRDYEAGGGGTIAAATDEGLLLALAWVSMWDLRFVDWANLLSQLPNGQANGRSPV